MTTIIFVACIFVTVWMGIIFVGATINKSLARDFPFMNILLWSISITGTITHIIGIW